MSLSREGWMHLSVSERIELVQDLWDSIAEEAHRLPLSDAQCKELDRRIASHESRPHETRTWAEVRERLEREATAPPGIEPG